MYGIVVCLFVFFFELFSGLVRVEGQKACKLFSVREGLAAQVHALWFMRENFDDFHWLAIDDGHR